MILYNNNLPNVGYVILLIMETSHNIFLIYLMWILSVYNYKHVTMFSL